ncbi:acyl-CoA dehydrogenase family protein [Henriciella litoralis]|uniref:acyl-CoA dehydrogenase family protein n=1 Tax=Henriciella litoralis TaxID=568102 RepID=UPI000A02A943|nr:acyl-CoA dehydrogenase family protein [Henriciella litoralis]
MDASFTEDQEMIREAAATYLRDWSDRGGFRKQVDASALDYGSVWQEFGIELGFAGLTIPEVQGGSGLGDLARALVMEEMGRVLFTSPYFASCVLAGDVLAAVGGSDAEGLLAKIASGERTATVCSLTSGSVRSGEITGVARNVVDGGTADLILVIGGDSLHMVDASKAGVIRSVFRTMDLTRPQADIKFAAAPAELVASGAGLSEVYALSEARSAIALAAEQAGGAGAMLDATVAYALERKQFGRLIGSFQAVKHRSADMMVLVEAARSAAYQAAALAHGPELFAQAAIAKSECSDAYFAVAGHAIQMHGGVGVTWEYDMHFHFKRARAGMGLLGSPEVWRERLAGCIGLEGTAA